ncbi:hypothetical protein ACYJ1Y_13025 [Natrialbaceae archaeon A-gly3]
MSVERLDPRRSVVRTTSVITSAVRRRDVAVVVGLTGIAYLLVYLYAIGNLTYQPGVGTDLFVVDQPLARAVEPGPGRFAYEPIAVVDLWTVRYLLSPINTAIGLGLATLVGLNLGLSYLAVAQPKSCGLGASSGLLASLPAVLAGSACCAPVILLVLGITAGGTLLAVIGWLLPVGVALLLASLVYLAGKIDPGALAVSG